MTGCKDTAPKVVVTGGGGYFGAKLAQRLVDAGYSVVALDVSFDHSSEAEEVSGDVRNVETLRNAFDGARAVFHTASYGMSKKAQLQTQLVHDINVRGTEAVIRACIDCDVKLLLYTSTYNVVFGGESIVAGDEGIPYFPLSRHCDAYSRSKAVAEQAVVLANGTPLPGGGMLHCTALRPAGIYGAGEQRHLARAAAAARMGWPWYAFGSPDSLVDMVHVDNLVDAHMLALQAMDRPGGGKPAGQAYCISDDAPVNMFEFLAPFVVGLGGLPPAKPRLPVCLIYGLAWLTEVVWHAVHRWWDFEPYLLRCEVNKIAVTHYFKMDKARADLGYDPVPSDLVKPKDMTGFLLGITSIGFWMVAQVPQLITNYRRQRADALSAWFLAEWLLGDTCNLLGCLLKGDQLPTVVFTAEYFICMDAVLLLQYMYYRMVQHRRERTFSYRRQRRHHWREETVDGGAVVSGDAVRSPRGSKSRGRGGRRSTAATAAALAAAGTGAVVVLAAAARGQGWGASSMATARAALPLAAAAGRLGGTAARRLLGGANLVLSQGSPGTAADSAAAAAAFTGIQGSAFGTGTAGTTLVAALAAGLGGSVGSLANKLPPWAYEVGVVLGYMSSVLYLASRVSQLARTAVRRSAEGLALSMFFVAVAANVTYGASILVRAQSMREVQAALPWLIGSLGTVALDVAILIQAKIVGTGDDKPAQGWSSHHEHSVASPRHRHVAPDAAAIAANGSDLHQPLLVTVEPAATH